VKREEEFAQAIPAFMTNSSLCYRAPLAKTPVGGPWRETGNETLALVTAKRSTSMKASTAALRRICQRLLLLQQHAPRHPASGRRTANFYSLTEGYFGLEGIPW
jgi:hypothetical protein